MFGGVSIYQNLHILQLRNQRTKKQTNFTYLLRKSRDAEKVSFDWLIIAFLAKDEKAEEVTLIRVRASYFDILLSIYTSMDNYREIDTVREIN